MYTLAYHGRTPFPAKLSLMGDENLSLSWITLYGVMRLQRCI
jgi:hypothetical protein